ncbi:hypothetical protein SCUP234_08235 [Seiridium cupressi]
MTGYDGPGTPLRAFLSYHWQPPNATLERQGLSGRMTESGNRKRRHSLSAACNAELAGASVRRVCRDSHPTPPEAGIATSQLRGGCGGIIYSHAGRVGKDRSLRARVALRFVTVRGYTSRKETPWWQATRRSLMTLAAVAKLAKISKNASPRPSSLNVLLNLVEHTSPVLGISWVVSAMHV